MTIRLRPTFVGNYSNAVRVTTSLSNLPQDPLVFSTAVVAPPYVAVSSGIVASPSPATVGQDLTYVVTTTNNSDAPATGVSF